jgi:hypothetical protein
MVPTYTVDVSRDELAAQTKNNPLDKARAEARVAEMQRNPADSGSMFLVDCEGRGLVAVFSHAMNGPTKEP